MSLSPSNIKLQDLEYYSYINQEGIINPELENKIGVYAIFNQEKNLEYIGYSRNLLLSLKQHLVRQIDKCYWFKYYVIDSPNRSILNEIRQNWLNENGIIPKGNQEEENLWTQAIDVKSSLTEEEQKEYENNDELGKIKWLKKLARQVETEIKNSLSARNINMEFRFNPKLKEQGLLDLK